MLPGWEWSYTEVLTWCRKTVHLHAEVVLEEEEADDGEEVDEEDGQHSRQNDRAAVPRHALYHVEQRLLSDHQVEQLRRGRSTSVSHQPRRNGGEMCERFLTKKL